jgi:histidinol dehydrogenase
VKIWNLDQEFDRLIAFVLEGREKRKTHVGVAVEHVRNAIQEKGEAAVVEFSRQWDEWEKDHPLKVSEKEIHEAETGIHEADKAVLKGMIKNVKAYHRGQKGRKRIYRRKGLTVTEEMVPLERAMVYVPGGTAPYPSSVIMGVVPAQLAGVSEIFVATPAKKGIINPYILAACSLLGINDVYRIGGAQAIYAFSYGTGSIPKVDVIVGPGNAYVEAAKRDVYGTVGIDMLAGPSELIVLATEPFSPEVIAWDLLSQAEHDEMAVVGLFSPSREHLEQVRSAMDGLSAASPRKPVMEKALADNGFLVKYSDKEKMVQAINMIAPEHMEVIGDEEEARRFLYPGIIYVGPCTPVALGDYYIGTNHVLPTSGAGRFTAGLSVDTFTKRKSVVKAEKEFVRQFADNAARLARIEGLFAHGEAILARKELL